MISKGDIEIRASEEHNRRKGPKDIHQSVKASKQSYKSSSINMSLELRNIEKNVGGAESGAT
tara:strand:+ start:308 stop:493 length:186 start_codon:yes stop_codon:yes gene_type:complete